VEHHQHAVARDAQVELDGIDTERDRLPERRERALRRVGAVAAMADHRAGQGVEEDHRSGVALRFCSTSFSTRSSQFFSFSVVSFSRKWLTVDGHFQSLARQKTRVVNGRFQSTAVIVRR
jgi:hypothetical protein